MISRRTVEPIVTFVNLIDVTMVLLIIFMITAPAMTGMVQVDLPRGKASQANISEGIVLSVMADGVISYGNEKIAPGDFEARFKDIWEHNQNESVYIRGDKNTKYGSVMNVIATVKEIGGETVGLVVEDKPKPRKR
jgi:biopolymer transport protein ExbD